MGNQTTTMTTNTVQKSIFTISGIGMTGTVRPTITGFARYAKVTLTASIFELFTQSGEV